MSPNQIVTSSSTAFFVIFVLFKMVPNTSGQSRTHLDQRQVSLIDVITKDLTKK